MCSRNDEYRGSTKSSERLIKMNENYQLSFKSKDCINSIKEKIKGAKTSIDIEVFYFIEDKVGSDFLILLIKKAKEGLKIRLLLDHVGSYDLAGSKTLEILKRHSIKVLFFNSLLPFSKNSKTIWYFRNHRRTIIIDQEYVFTGSVCFGEPTSDWLELGIFVKDTGIAKRVQIIFNQTWNKVYHPTFNIGSVSANDLKAKNDFNYITQAPLQFRRHIYKYYLKSIKNATETVYLVSPYVIPDTKFVRYLIAASKRQVKIHLIIPKKTEWVIIDIARNTHIHRLLKHNIHIYFHEKMVHSKLAIFDNKEAFVGSMNLDNLSLRYNYENGIKVLNQQCVAELDNYIQTELLPHCVELNIESWSNRGLIMKIVEKFVWTIRRFL